jgi:antitoxin ParD1/3/4
MQIQLSGKAEEIVKEKLALGSYVDAVQFVSEIILRADEQGKRKLPKLRQAIQVGLDQLNRGEGVPLDLDKINAAIDQELGYAKQ